MYKVGSDIGGTFTDTIFLDDETGDLVAGKVLTTPEDPSVGAVRGVSELLGRLGARGDHVRNIIHGTTLVTNAIIERKGAKTALITTRGFRDVLEARNEGRYELYDVFFELPKPLVPRYLRREVTERLAHDGSVMVSLDEHEAEEVVRDLVREGVEAIGVCFLHSFRNPAHERTMGAIVQRVEPRMFVSLSVEVNPEIREYPRSSTTVANAYSQPLMEKYMGRMEDGLRAKDFGGPLHVMLSSGGITTSEAAKKFPVRVLESGPAAGAIAASFYGELLGANRVISFDMGGTTAKICFIDDAQPTTATDYEVARVHRFHKGSGLPIKLPVIDMIEIGAGGGSIAWTDRLGLLKVGPQSAGADPGPVCYGRGGSEPTVTDADLMLGYLDAGYFLGGTMALDVEGAREAIGQKVATPLSTDLARAALGIVEVVNENMVNAARVYAAEQGKDTKKYTLVAFGGAGPVHAHSVAKRLGIERLVVPFRAGVMSAMGFLASPFSFDLVRTYMAPLDGLDWEKLSQVLGEMEAEGVDLLKGAGIKENDIELKRTCEMRYTGQGHEIEVPVPPGRLGPSDCATIQANYDREYERLYHRINVGYKVECLNWRVVARGPKPVLNLKVFPSHGKSVDQALKGSRQVYFPDFGAYRSCPVYDHYSLFDGATLEGPAIVEERESTTVVGPGSRVTTDRYLNLIVEWR
ncbi:MAG: hydantoinase/oxoprolinase family protein [Chloroflexi bacterium]|nr:hydantoinase/oxoprolinase family protein [Chloroflexota bacterium]